MKQKRSIDTNKKALKRTLTFYQHLVDRGRTEFNRADILNFLNDQVEKRQDFPYFDYKASICEAIRQAEGVDLAAEFEFKSQAAAMRQVKPKVAEFDQMWSIEIVWEKLKQKYIRGHKYYDMDLRMRALVLTRLSVAGRNGDVAHIHRPSMIVHPDYIKFRFFKWKNQRKEKTLFSNWIHIKKLPDVDRYRCAYASLREYLRRNEGHYKTCSHPYLWLTYKRDGPVKASTLAKDANTMLDLCDIKPPYRSKTFRHAAISYWRRMNIPYTEVMKRTGHRSEKVVRTFYDKAEISQDLMAKLIEDESSEEEREWHSEFEEPEWEVSEDDNECLEEEQEITMEEDSTEQDSRNSETVTLGRISEVEDPDQDPEREILPMVGPTHPPKQRAVVQRKKK
jgi:hypothetical protein